MKAFILLFTALFALSTGGQTHESSAPLSKFLNANGALKRSTGDQGNLDPKEWRVTTGPSGEPHYIHDRTSPTRGEKIFSDDQYWDDRFDRFSDLDKGAICAVAVTGDTVYVGGYLTVIDGVPVSGIATWDGKKWSNLDGGVGWFVYDIAFNNGKLYAGGNFGILQWDGQHWSGLGSGVNNSVRAITFIGSDLYVGGDFTQAGTIVVNHVARWNTASGWSALGSGIRSDSTIYVTSLTHIGNDLYVGGLFDTAGEASAKNVAKWNGITWSALGSGTNNLVNCLNTKNTDLYVGGNFSKAGDAAITGIAKWDGATWTSIGQFSGLVYSIAFVNSLLTVGGYLNTHGGFQYLDHILQWNGNTWQRLKGGTNRNVMDMAVNDSLLYAVGDFTNADTVPATFRAVWDGKNWRGIMKPRDYNSHQGVNDGVTSMAINDSILYIGGYFSQAGNIGVNSIAKWNGSSWSSLGSGLDNYPMAIASNGKDVYAGGLISRAGEVDVNNIAHWDGTAWSALGSGLNGYCTSIAIKGNDVYVAGAFTQAGGINTNYIARWDGSAWHPLGIGLDHYAHAITIIENDIYVGGQFTHAGGMNANYIARWDGTLWHALGKGFNNIASSLTSYGNYLYACGWFTKAGDENVNYVAQWDGSSWSSLPFVFSYNPYSAAANKNGMYVTGAVPHSGISRWDGDIWLGLGSGLNGGLGTTVVTNGTDVYVGGSFSQAGQKDSRYFAHWNKPEVMSVALDPHEHSLVLNQNYPNPFSSLTTIKVWSSSNEVRKLEVMDMLGQVVYHTVIEPLQKEIIFDGSHLSNGIYIYAISDGVNIEAKKMMVNH